jgi:hypothetical protein
VNNLKLELDGASCVRLVALRLSAHPESGLLCFSVFDSNSIFFLDQNTWNYESGSALAVMNPTRRIAVLDQYKGQAPTRLLPSSKPRPLHQTNS